MANDYAMEPAIKDCFEKLHHGEGFLCVPFKEFQSKLELLGYSFSIRHSKKQTTNPAFSHKQIHLLEKNSVPFQTKKRIVYNCSAGPLYYSLKKNMADDHATMAKKSRFFVQNTKKQGCAASIVVFEIDFFTDYVLKSNGWREKKKVLQELRNDLISTIKNITRESKTYIKMRGEHNHSIITTQLGQKVNDLIKSEIRRIIYEENVTNVALIKTFLYNYIKHNDIKTSPTSRSFFLDNRTIYNYVLKYTYEKKKTKTDAEAVGVYLEDNKEYDYRPNLKRIRENAKKLIDISYVIDFNNNNHNLDDVLNGTIEVLENSTETLKKYTEEGNLTLLPKCNHKQKKI